MNVSVFDLLSVEPFNCILQEVLIDHVELQLILVFTALEGAEKGTVVGKSLEQGKLLGLHHLLRLFGRVPSLV